MLNNQEEEIVQITDFVTCFWSNHCKIFYMVFDRRMTMFCFFIYENVKKLLSEIFPEIFPYIFRLIYQIQLWEKRLVYSKVDILSKLKRGHTKFITYSVAVENKFTIFCQIRQVTIIISIWKSIYSIKPVSYTHLTLPTILLV